MHTILTFTDEQVTTIYLICCRNIAYKLSFKSVGARLVKALQTLLFDWNWELRESAVGFLAFIFGSEEQVSVLSTLCCGINIFTAGLRLFTVWIFTQPTQRLASKT